MIVWASLVCLSPDTLAKADTFTPTDFMPSPHGALHTATLLPNGKVLVTGGYTADANCTAAADVFDPETRTWTAAPDMSEPRGAHTATLLPDGTVLVAGGFSGGNTHLVEHYLASVEIYDPARNIWTLTNSMNMRRSDHRAVRLTNGNVLVIGGFHLDNGGHSISSAETYDPSNGSWIQVNDMSLPRNGHAAVLLPNGKVLVAGGRDFFGWLATCEVFDPATGGWTGTGDMNTRRANRTMAVLPDGLVLMVGGNGYSPTPLAEAEIYNPATEAWTTNAPSTSPRYDSTMTLLPNGKVLVLGGPSEYNNPDAYAPTEVFDSITHQWALAAQPVNPRLSPTATMLTNGQVLIAGGWFSTDEESKSAELYTPDPSAGLRISDQPTGSCVYWGGEVTLEVAAVGGTAPYRYQWFKDELPVSDATNAVLRLVSFKDSDVADYKAVVSDLTTASVTSRAARLTIKTADLRIVVTDGNARLTITGVVGQTYSLQAANDLSSATNWVGLANLTFTALTHTWDDPESVALEQRYYRVQRGPQAIR